MPPRLSQLLSAPAARWVIVVPHLAFLFLLYRQHGMHGDKEALKYLGAAADLLHGDPGPTLHRYALYAGYILFLTPFVAVGLPELAVVAQITLGITAAFALRRLTLRFGGSQVAANAAMAVYLLAYPIQEWTLSLYSEGLFVPLIVLFLEQASRQEYRPWRVGLLAVALLITRPTGILFVAPALLLLPLLPFHRLHAAWRWAAVSALLPAMLVAPVMNREQLAVVAGSHVVCGFPEHPEDADRFTGRTLAEAQAFVVRHHGAGYWAGLALRRAASLLHPRRDHFSPLHNGIAAGVVLLHPIAVLGLWRQRRLPIAHAIAACLLLNIVLVALTYDEWGGRFLAPLLPLVIVAAAAITGAAAKRE